MYERENRYDIGKREVKAVIVGLVAMTGFNAAQDEVFGKTVAQQAEPQIMHIESAQHEPVLPPKDQ